MRTGITNSLSAFAIFAWAAVAFAAKPEAVPDGNAHPYVGLMVAQDSAGRTLWRCSGALVGPTLFLTAGHCVRAPATRVEIWFNSNVGPANGFPVDGPAGGRPYTHPSYNPRTPDRFDLGVVVLDLPLVLGEYALFPALDALDAFDTKKGKKDASFTLVGYVPQGVYARMSVSVGLKQINNGRVGTEGLLLENGGVCAADSGVPVFIGNTSVIAGVLSEGQDVSCGGGVEVYRIDRFDDLSWLFTTFSTSMIR